MKRRAATAPKAKAEAKAQAKAVVAPGQNEAPPTHTDVRIAGDPLGSNPPGTTRATLQPAAALSIQQPPVVASDDVVATQSSASQPPNASHGASASSGIDTSMPVAPENDATLRMSLAHWGRMYSTPPSIASLAPPGFVLSVDVPGCRWRGTDAQGCYIPQVSFGPKSGRTRREALEIMLDCQWSASGHSRPATAYLSQVDPTSYGSFFDVAEEQPRSYKRPRTNL